ncbi:MAG: Nif3-like dinuclear metal center hexameric protein [Spirochaetota bacterium]|nr:Nif3-like dinuclear metal center hexameric protein [Spirochaetota bacterium]
MSKLKDIVSFINEYLKVDQFQDYCPNGLQVEGNNQVNHIVSGVSASYELFEKAHKIDGDLILVHHGLIWGNNPITITGNFKRRLKILLDHSISLIAYHLPLDAHEEVGNNAIIAKQLELVDTKTFAKYKGRDIGVTGFLKNELSLIDIENIVKSLFNANLTSYPFGNSTIKKIAVVSGGASEQLIAASERECDLFLTGEVSESTMHLAKEEKINFIAAGHYNTEKLGVQAISERVAKEFNIKHTFIDIPNTV